MTFYKTRVCAPYRTDAFAFTQSKDQTQVFAIWMDPCMEEKKQESAESTKGRKQSEGAATGKLCIPYNEEIQTITSINGAEKIPFTRNKEGYWIIPPKSSNLLDQYGRVFLLIK